MANILNQDEIDSLLGAMERGEIDESEKKSSESGLDVREYDFHRPQLITKEQLRYFTNVHEDFAREMTSTLALFLRTNVEFSLVSTEQQLYKEFINSLSKVTHAVVFTVEPLPGMAVAEINLSLVFGVEDMLLGGQGDVETELRKPTEIEISILDPFVERLVDQLQNSWKSLMEVRIRRERYESDPEYFQAAPNDAPVVVMAFDTKVGLANGIINICYPLPMIQALLEQMAGAEGQMDTYYGKGSDDETREQMMDAILDVPLPVDVELGTARILSKELITLSPGDIIVLNQSVTNLLDMNVSGRRAFACRPGRSKDQISIKIQDRIMVDQEKPNLELNKQ